MAGPNLPTNIASGGTTSGHKTTSDTVHTYVNKLDTTFLSPSDNNVLTYDNATGTYKPEAPVAGSHAATEVYLSELTGASDDAKLLDFINTYNIETQFKPHLVLDEVRKYDFDIKREIDSGFAMVGPNRAVTQAISRLPVPHEVEIRSSGGLFELPDAPTDGTTHGMYFGNLTIDGSATNRFMDGHADTVLRTTTFHNISSQNQGGFLGSLAQPLQVTAINFSGFHNHNNLQEPFIVMSGSDIYLTPDKLLLDTGGVSNLAVSKYAARFENVSNCWVSNWYVTAEPASAFFIDGNFVDTGSASDESLFIINCVLEGRNNSEPCSGALIRMHGGQAMIDDCRFAYAMADPTGPGRSPTDAGVIHVTDGTLDVRNSTYRNQSGVAQTVPFVYANGSTTVVRVQNIRPQGTWTGKPVVSVNGGATAYVDDSVTAIKDSTSKIIRIASDSIGHNFQTGTTYTAVLLDQGRMIEMNNASANDLTLPQLPEGTVLHFRQYGAGVTSLVAGSGVTFQSGVGTSPFTVAARYGEGKAVYRSTTEVILSGNIA